MRPALKALALIALLGAPVGAKDSAMTWKNEKNELFGAQVPDLWRRKPLSGAKAGYMFTDGVRFISVSRPGKDLKTYLASKKADAPEIESSTVTVLGKPADRLKRVYRARNGGDEGPGPSEWVYEETVLIPDKAGFWQLQFQSSSARPKPAPAALEAWDKFLKSFKPAAVK